MQNINRESLHHSNKTLFQFRFKYKSRVSAINPNDIKKVNPDKAAEFESLPLSYSCVINER